MKWMVDTIKETTESNIVSVSLGEDLKMKTPERGAEMKRPVPRFRETPEMVFSESMYVTPKPESKDDKAGTPDWMNDTFVLPRRREDPDNKVSGIIINADVKVNENISHRWNGGRTSRRTTSPTWWTTRATT